MHVFFLNPALKRVLFKLWISIRRHNSYRVFHVAVLLLTLSVAQVQTAELKTPTWRPLIIVTTKCLFKVVSRIERIEMTSIIIIELYYRLKNNFTDKPTFDPYQELIESTEGDNVFVTLQAKGRPSQITYKWFKNNKPLYSLHGRRIRDSNMNITGVFRDDAGNYTCEASNTEGFSTFSFVLSVERKHRSIILLFLT